VVDPRGNWALIGLGREGRGGGGNATERTRGLVWGGWENS